MARNLLLMATKFTLPWPPSVNRIWRRGRNGVTYLSAEGKKFKHDAGIAMHGAKPTDRPVAATLRIYFPQKAGDLDNRCKLVMDSMEGFAFLNDKQVCEKHEYRYLDRKNPRIEVTIEERENMYFA